MKKIDLHIHTYMCGHAHGELYQFVETGIKNGFTIIGFAEHFPMRYQPEFSAPISELTMTEDQIDYYLSTIDSLNKKYGDKIKILKGFEVDYFPEENLFFKKYLNLIDKLDYFICSIHFIGEYGLDQRRNKEKLLKLGVKNLWDEYLNRLNKMIDEYHDILTIIGHIDVPKKIGEEFRIPQNLYPDMIKILEKIKKYDLVLEINTSGLIKPIKEIFPSSDIIKEAVNLGIEFTFGSDAHAPEKVGRNYQLAVEILKKFGVNKLVYFNKFKKEYVKI